jgi:hypothetical protein
MFLVFWVMVSEYGKVETALDPAKVQMDGKLELE